MDRKAYILVFDRDDDLEYSKLHMALIKMEGILTWSHYLKSSYIFISDEPDALVMTERVMKIFIEKRFLLMEASLVNKNGWLPKEAWIWINKERDKIKKLR